MPMVKIQKTDNHSKFNDTTGRCFQSRCYMTLPLASCQAHFVWQGATTPRHPQCVGSDTGGPLMKKNLWCVDDFRFFVDISKWGKLNQGMIREWSHEVSEFVWWLRWRASILVWWCYIVRLSFALYIYRWFFILFVNILHYWYAIYSYICIHL